MQNKLSESQEEGQQLSWREYVRISAILSDAKGNAHF